MIDGIELKAVNQLPFENWNAGIQCKPCPQYWRDVKTLG
jgi:hypothetical protein